MRAVRAGKLRQRVTIETAAETPNSFNEPARSWSQTATAVDCAIGAVSGRLRFVAEQFEGEVFHEVVMRYRTDVVALKTRLRTEDGRVFLVQFVDNEEERNRRLNVLAREILGEDQA